MKRTLSTLLHSKAFNHINEITVYSFELAFMESTNWLNKNNYINFVSESEINKGTQSGEYSYRYGISFTFFENEIDDLKSNFVGCSMSFFQKNNILHFAIVTYSIYEEIKHLKIDVDDSQNFDLNSISDKIENEVNNIPKHMINCLEKYFNRFPRELMKPIKT